MSSRDFDQKTEIHRYKLEIKEKEMKTQHYQYANRALKREILLKTPGLDGQEGARIKYRNLKGNFGPSTDQGRL